MSGNKRGLELKAELSVNSHRAMWINPFSVSSSGMQQLRAPDFFFFSPPSDSGRKYTVSCFVVVVVVVAVFAVVCSDSGTKCTVTPVTFLFLYQFFCNILQIKAEWFRFSLVKSCCTSSTTNSHKAVP